MKISELQSTTNLNDDMQFVISLSGDNRRISLGAIASYLTPFVSFSRVQEVSGQINTNDFVFAENDKVIYDPVHKRFLAAINQNDGGWVYYRNWNGYDQFFNGLGDIKRNRIFVSDAGNLYISKGLGLYQITLTPIELTD